MVIEQKEEGLSVLLEGELGHHEALSALRSLEETISQQSPSRLELDFSGVSFMDSSGIALVVQVGGNLCRDAGESALASVVETAGTLCALLAALPLLRAVLDMLMELMG